MARLKHPNLAQLMGVCYHNVMLLVTELLPLGPLNLYLRSNQADIPLPKALRFASQIASGMAFMEQHRFERACRVEHNRMAVFAKLRCRGLRCLTR